MAKPAIFNTSLSTAAWACIESKIKLSPHEKTPNESGNAAPFTLLEWIDGHHAINLQGLTPGLYIIEIQTLHSAKRTKVLKN